MTDFEAPSFSLGLDLDLDLDLDAEPHVPPHNPAPDSSTNGSLEDEQVVDSDPDLGPEPPRILKRLRRGIGTTGSSASAVDRESRELCGNGDDDIEDFSSQEGILEADEHPLKQYNSVCSTSKVPWHQRGVLMTKSSTKSKAPKKKQASHFNASVSLGTSNKNIMFPKLTSSPLRRFQLIDSDSDDPSADLDANGEAHTIDVSIKARQSKSVQCPTFAEQSRGNASVSKPQNQDFWKDFCPMSSKIVTPALDEVCEEYFQSVKDKTVTQKPGRILLDSSQKGLTSQMDEQHRDLTGPLPPAHRYFFHDDPRIQKLVRSRLLNFCPLGVNSGGNRQLGSSVIDYMSQFGNEGTSKQPAAQNSNLGRKKSKDSNAMDVSHASEGWVEPKHNASNPKDAGKRRVQADSQAAGHWYTNSDGKRVYVTKNGQELAGRVAYQRYKKESGAGFKRSNKKTSAKKTNTKKNNTRKRKR